MSAYDTKSIKSIENFISSYFGISLLPYKEETLSKVLVEVCKEYGLKSLDEILSYTNDKRLLKILAKHFLVNESYFFRDNRFYKTLENNILPKLIIKRSKLEQPYLRIWSAGCSRGEEPYSIAMLLQKLLPDIHRWNITIFATDANEFNLDFAKKGTYTPWSFRETPPAWIERYFKKDDNTFILDKKIKKMVTFDKLNLITEHFPSFLNNTSDIDIILCKNVFIYFNKESIKTITSKFYDCLVDNGILSLAVSENSLDIYEKFKMETIDNVTLFKKDIDKPVYKYEINLENEDERDVEIKKIQYEEEKEKKVVFVKEIIEDIHTLVNVGNINEALTLCEKGLEEFNEDVEINYLYGELLSQISEDKKAMKIFKKLLYINSDLIVANIALANLYKKLDLITEANRYFQKVYKLLSKMDNDEVVSLTNGLDAGYLLELVKKRISEFDNG